MTVSNNILIIEDEPGILNNIVTILQMYNYNCFKANDGAVAIDMLTQQLVKPQLILCDVMMPNMDGFEVLTFVRNNEETKNIPFCFLTARADVLDINNGLEIGANAYITKPFTAKDLLATVKRLLLEHS